MRKLALLLILLILAACGGDDDDNGDNGDNGDGQSNPPVSSADFSFTVSGADERTVTEEDGTIAYTVLDVSELEAANIPTRHELFMYEGSFSADLHQVTIMLPPDVEPGSYELTGQAALMQEDAFIASYSAIEGGETIADSVSREFGQNVSGTLTITAAGDSISGSFDFNADFTDFTESGEISETVTVRGEFVDVPLMTG